MAACPHLANSSSCLLDSGQLITRCNLFCVNEGDDPFAGKHGAERHEPLASVAVLQQDNECAADAIKKCRKEYAWCRPSASRRNETSAGCAAVRMAAAEKGYKIERRQMPPMHRYFISRYSSMPYLEPSRPRPDCLTPPNGPTSLEMMPVLIPTIPYSSFSATRQTRPISRE